ncbi:MAG: hypothetical protein NTX79_05705 [Candidatus Micrarchaeota archaeon]|nr:hypothetical protein [Candidatus Micrarchaeota archaeon]
MNPIFTLDYSEFAVAEELSKRLQKNDGYRVLMPVNRQNKGFDLVVLNTNNRKIIKVQVKGGRSYDGTNKPDGHYWIWHNNFMLEGRDVDADWIIVHATYCYDKLHPKIRGENKVKIWKNLYLFFKKNEMKTILNDFENRKRKQYDFKFNVDNKGNIVYAQTKYNIDLNKHLIDNKIEEFKKELC